MATHKEKLMLHIGAKDDASKTLDRVKTAVIGIGAAYLGWQGAKTIISDIVNKAKESEKVWNDGGFFAET